MTSSRSPADADADQNATNHANLKQHSLLVRETRLGIGRDDTSRSAAEQQLYQTCHIRPVPQLVFDVELVIGHTGRNPRKAARPNEQNHIDACAALLKLEQSLGSGCIVRLGAEGHSAHVSVVKPAPRPTLLPPACADGAPPRQVTIIFTTAADFGQSQRHGFGADWKPGNFARTEAPDGSITWCGFPHAESGVKLEIVSAVCGKYQREGGWDNTRLASDENGQLKRDAHGKTLSAPGPRDARALLPAGSMWFCNVLQGDITRLYGQQLGIGRELGRGEIAIGTWGHHSKTETTT